MHSIATIFWSRPCSLHNSIRQPEQFNGPDYKRAVEPLRRLRLAVSDVHYLYTMELDGSKVRFVLDAADPGSKNSDGIDEQSGIGEVYEGRDPAMLQALGNGRRNGIAAATQELYPDKWGSFMTGWAPILDEAGRQIGVVGVDVDARTYVARLAAVRHWALFGLAPAGVLIAILGVAFYRIRLRGLLDAQAGIEAAEVLAAAALRDKLTGLTCRPLFMERLQEAVVCVNCGQQSLFAVLFLDFDRFKLVNDTLGHEAGDELLRQIARRLQSALQPADTICEGATGNLIARFGGDEFLVLINDLESPADASLVAERLLSVLAPAYSILGSEVLSTASIGIVTSERCPVSAEEVVRNADVAMYEAKRAGRACSVVFSEAMHTRRTRHVAIESSLRKAIGNAELCLVYQPIVELNSGRMVSAEALVRWNHPTLGPISPSEFIPIAEESGLMGAVGEWVLKEACQALVAWRHLDPQHAPKTVSVNISRAELALGSRLLNQVRGTLECAGLPAKCLQLEITEREVTRNPEASLKVLHELRHLGVQLALDDFGAGTFSLALLRNYPFDAIKIHRSLVKDLTISADVLAVVHATVNLIDNLGMASVVDGVEDPVQIATLQAPGCRYAQGYIFSRPVPADRLLGALGSRVDGRGSARGSTGTRTGS